MYCSGIMTLFNGPSKSCLRRTIAADRDALTPRQIEQQSARLHLRVLELNAESWFIYVSTGSEVSTHALIRLLLHRGQRVSVPRIVGPGCLEAHRIERFEQLVPGRFGILEPPEDWLEPAPDLCLLPCLAVTMAGSRLGHGGGYYDRYLARHPAVRPVALAFDNQILDSLPTESHDRAMDLVVTPTQTFRCLQ